MAKLTLESINAALASPESGVRIIQRGDRLSLRATLPPRTGSGPWSQTTISLRVYATPDGLALARARAFELASDLGRSRFSWDDWQRIGMDSGDRCSDWIDRYKASLPTISDRLWRNHYQYLQRLPQDRPLDSDAIARALRASEPNSRTRQVACQKLAALAKFAGIEFDFEPYKAKYQPKERKLPTDRQIEEAIDSIGNRPWRTVAALMATYGLRDHECWHSAIAPDEDGRLICRVSENTKTGSREVVPFPPEWCDRWDLTGELILPPIRAKQHRDYSDRTSKHFRRCKLPFQPYDLRHCWCVRAAVVYRMADSVAARWAGHSVDLHASLYQRYVSQAQQLQAYDEAIRER